VISKTLFALLIALVSFDTSVTVDHNLNGVGTREFKFKRLPSPAKDDIAARAKLTLVAGVLDPAGGDLSALTDGRLPGDEDQPGANLFFNSGSSGGRFRMDFGTTIEITQVNSYSWHPNSRGPQLYKLYVADGSESALNLSPKRGVDPVTCGWKYIATVNTIPPQGEDGGQYAVSVTDTTGSLGRYRYLLFDCYVTELYDNNGNTFYSEIDVVGKP
jgi:hypothetical protein